jgi:hypothetical protein
LLDESNKWSTGQAAPGASSGDALIRGEGPIIGPRDDIRTEDEMDEKLAAGIDLEASLEPRTAANRTSRAP